MDSARKEAAARRCTGDAASTARADRLTGQDLGEAGAGPLRTGSVGNQPQGKRTWIGSQVQRTYLNRCKH